MAEDLIARVEKVFGSVFGKSVRFDPALVRTDETRWTSLRHVEFIIALEGEFDVRFDGADATDMTSIPVVVDRVGQRLK